LALTLINEEREADLSAAIAKYKGVPQDIIASRILELTRSGFRTGVDLISFADYCEIIACGWASYMKQLEMRGWPEIHVIARRHVIINHIGGTQLGRE
jgi:hypothetical protein